MNFLLGFARLASALMVIIRFSRYAVTGIAMFLLLLTKVSARFGAWWSRRVEPELDKREKKRGLNSRTRYVRKMWL